MRGKSVSMPLFDFRIEARPSDGMARLIWYFRNKADSLFAFMRNYLKPGMTFVDVGANIGSHTIYGARLVKPQGKVLSFEADPDTFAFLEANVRSNRVVNAVLFNQCVSDRQGTATFNLNPDSARNSLVRGGCSQVSLPTSRLDDLLPSGLQIDFLKIDVEGAELLVLSGAKRIFQDNPPRVVVVEATSCETEIKAFLVSHGYRIYHLDHSRSCFVEVSRPVFDTYAVRDCMRHELSNFSFSVVEGIPC
jgi:FkbM family methyltransferase